MATRPRPKYLCQTQLTATRAVSGLAGSTIHRARSSRVGFAFGRQRRQHGRRARLDLDALAQEVAADHDVRLARRPSASVCACVGRGSVFGVIGHGLVQLGQLLVGLGEVVDQGLRLLVVRFSPASFRTACTAAGSFVTSSGFRPSSHFASARAARPSCSRRRPPAIPPSSSSKAALLRLQRFLLAGQRRRDVHLVVAVEEGEELVVLALAERIVLVIVALAAAERQAEPDLGRWC